MRIDILLYDDCLGSEVFAFADTLMMAEKLAAAGMRGRAKSFEIRFVSTDAATRTLAGGLAQLATGPAGSCDLLVIPGTSFDDREGLIARIKALKAEQVLIRRHWTAGKRVAAICVGAFLVCAAGIATGRRIATGWPVADLLPSIDSGVTIVADEMVVADGALLTSGATTAAYDLALCIVSGECGAEVAYRLRKILLLEPNRPGQQVFSRMSSTTPAALGPVHRAKTYLRENLSQPFVLADLAAASGSSTRSLQRNFKRQTGLTPLTFLQLIRIDQAKHLLETTRLPISQIAIEVGYLEEASFRNLFRKLAGMGPGAFRARFSTLKS